MTAAAFVVFRSKRLLVPANTISRVIGRGGCNINAIRDISTAQVEIDRSRDSTTERIITIKWVGFAFIFVPILSET